MALARAVIARAVFDSPTRRALIERLRVDRTLDGLCGSSGACRLPGETIFSCSFDEFANSALASRLHEALRVWHIWRHATAITGRWKPLSKAPQAARPKRQRGRPGKSE